MEYILSRFNSEAAYQKYIQKTIADNFALFEELKKRERSIVNALHPVDFSFTSNNISKLEHLGQSLLSSFNCTVNAQEEVANAIFMREWSVDAIPIDINVINEWILDLFKHGQNHDCLFNGWDLY